MYMEDASEVLWPSVLPPYPHHDPQDAWSDPREWPGSVTWFLRGFHVVASDVSRHASSVDNARACRTVKMRIEELILEGFKSYPVRTQITGWDPSFNAITGLNGSGKSNILDAICFVLGLTNLSSVRIPLDPFFLLLIAFLVFRCAHRISKISSINVDRLASQRPLSR